MRAFYAFPFLKVKSPWSPCSGLSLINTGTGSKGRKRFISACELQSTIKERGLRKRPQSRNLEVGTEAGILENPGEALPTICWALSKSSLIKKIPYRHAHRPIW